MNGFKDFWEHYKGAIIGNYVQQNKEDVKTKLKSFIDKM